MDVNERLFLFALGLLNYSAVVDLVFGVELVQLDVLVELAAVQDCLQFELHLRFLVDELFILVALEVEDLAIKVSDALEFFKLLDVLLF